MHETPAFGVEFAKLALLTNVGRINTTMACKRQHVLFLYASADLNLLPNDLLLNDCLMDDDIAVFPEMKTALRTYHPVPSLQKTDGNAQDAPRIKNCLKAALLPYEVNPPSTPDDILQRLVRLRDSSRLILVPHKCHDRRDKVTGHPRAS